MQYKILPLLSTMLAMANAVKLYVCTSKDFTGECSNFDTPRGQCSALPFNDAISSIQMNGHSCEFFTHKDCTGSSVTFSEDQSNLRDGTWNDQLTSIKCP